MPERNTEKRRQEKTEEVVALMAALAEEIALAWISPSTALELLEEQRR